MYSVDTSLTPWLSLYYTYLNEYQETGIRFTVKEQCIDLDFATLGGFEYFSESSRFGVLRGITDYTSKYLKAHIAVDVYSTERRADSPVGDIQFERFIKEGSSEPISGVFDFRINLPEAYLKTGYKMLTLSIGKQKIRFGPGYKGTLGWSGTAYSPFYFYHMNLAFGTLFNMKAFL